MYRNNFWRFLAEIWPKKWPHHVMDAACWYKVCGRSWMSQAMMAHAPRSFVNKWVSYNLRWEENLHLHKTAHKRERERAKESSISDKSWFREADEDSNSSILRVWRFTEWPGPLHWIVFPVGILTKPLIHWMPPPPFHWKNPFLSLKSALSHPLLGDRWTQSSQTQFDKITTRETIYKYIRKFPIKVHRGRGQNFPIFTSCRYLVELGPRQLGLPAAERT